MDDEDEFETYFRRAMPIKQLSQQYSPTAKTPTTTRRASLQASDGMYSIHAAASGKRSSPSPSRDVFHETKTSTTPTSPHRHSLRRRSRQPQRDDVERHRERSSSPSSTAASTAAIHVDQSSHSPGSRSGRHRRSPLMSIVSSPADVTTRRTDSRSPPAAPRTPCHGRRATLAGDLLQIPPTFVNLSEVDRRSSSVRSASTSPRSSRGARRQYRMESGQSWAHSEDRDLSAVSYCRENAPAAGGSRGSHVVRTFRLSTRGVVNVRNAVHDDEVFCGDDDVEVRTGRAERPTALRHASTARRSSTAVDHSPRLSPQRVVAAAAAVCREMYADQSSSRRWRPEQPDAAEYKVLVVGDHGVGKTELIRHFTSSYLTNSSSSGLNNNNNNNNNNNKSSATAAVASPRHVVGCHLANNSIKSPTEHANT